MSSTPFSHLATDFEFVDIDQIWGTSNAPGLTKPNQPSAAADPFLYKLEPKVEWQDLDYNLETKLKDIKLEELIIKDEAVDVGDHCYARSKISIQGDHCYAKATKHEVFDLYMQLWTESQADAVVDLESYVDAGQASKFEFVDVNQAGDDELTVDDGGKLLEGVGRVETVFGVADLGQKNSWQVDLKALLKETYLKERGFPVGKDLPLRPPEVIQVESDSDCESSGDNSYEADVLERDANNAYMCHKCSYRTTQKTVLKNHLKIHSGEKPFKCGACDYRTVYKWNLEQHQRLHTGDKPYKCSVCDFEGTYKYHLIKHLETHADVLPYKCTRCGFRDVDEVSVALHEQSHFGHLQCHICVFATSKISVMANHMIRHSREKGTGDDFVESPAKDPATELVEELRPPKLFRCASCEYTVNSKAALFIHMQTHTIGKPYKCIKCNYSAMTSGAVNKHMMIHRTDVPYKCGECEYRTHSSIYLLNHRERHRPGTALYNCSKCSYVSHSKSRLEAHLKKHVAQKLFKCKNKLCSFTCGNDWELYNHVRVHLRYACKFCGAQVLSRLQLAYHKRIHTKSEPKRHDNKP